MTDENGDNVATQGDWQPPAGGDEGAPTPPDDGQSPEPGEEGASDGLILGKYKSQEDLIKAYQSTQAEGTRMAQELAQMKRDLETERERGRLAETLDALGNKLKPEDEGEAGEKPLDFDTFVEMNAEKWRDDPVTAIRDAINLSSSWTQTEVKKVMDWAKKEIADRDNRLSEVQSKLERLDPDYQRNKELVETLMQQGGVDLQTAKRLAVQIRSKDGPLSASRLVPPASVSTERRADSQPAKKPLWDSTEQRDYFLREYGKEEVAEMERMHAERQKQKGSK